MALDPQAKELLDFIALFKSKPMEEIGAVEARKNYDTRPTNLSPEYTALFKVEDQLFEHDNVKHKIRIYTPSDSKKPLPLLVFYHGGGMVIGSLDGYDTLCRQLAKQSNCIIASVDYRLAPEHKFPTAVNDAYAALEWAHANAESFNADKNKIAVGGDSAGGSLAAVVTIMARDRKVIKLQFQLLIYPATAPHADSESQIKFGKGFFLERPTILWFHESYIRNDADRDDFRYAPLIADSHVNLPPTFLLVGECDPLRDEGVAYAKILKESDVAVTLKEYAGMIHPFLSLAGVLDKGKEAISDCAKQLKKALH